MANFVPVPAEVETPPPQQRKLRNQQGQGYYYQAPSPEDMAYAAHLAVQTIEFLFSPDNLAQDQYLRSLFDVDGRVPLLYVAQYPQVAYLGADWSGLKERIRESRVLEWDESNETIRVRENWQIWVPRGVSHKYSMPGTNPNGGGEEFAASLRYFVRQRNAFSAILSWRSCSAWGPLGLL